MNKKIVILGGGTLSYVTNHFTVCAEAYGMTATRLSDLCQKRFNDFDYEDPQKEDGVMDVRVYRTRMGGGASFSDWIKQYRDATKNPNATVQEVMDAKFEPVNVVTNKDVSELVDKLVEDDTVRVVFFSVAMCNLEPVYPGAGKYADKIEPAADGTVTLTFKTAEKVINKIRKKRKDIFLVGFKTTTNRTEDQQYLEALDLCKTASCNLVLANDVVTRTNMIVTPEEARYHVTKDREEVLKALVDMTWHRTHLNFTRSTVIAGSPVEWSSRLVPAALRTVVNYCVAQNAYKPFNGATAGHFACKLGETTFLTSIRKTDFNDLEKTGLVLVKTDGPDTVLAYGAKPSVGGQSQRIVFQNHPGHDCIVHFHCPLKPGSDVPVVSQREFECGSHQCGANTSNGLKQYGNLKAVFLDQHGPNIVFPTNIDPQEVITFIEANFDLSQKTGGFVSATHA